MTTVEFSEVAKILGGKKVLRRELRDLFDFIEVGGRGVSKTALMKLAQYLNLSLSQIAKLLPVSERTILRYDANKTFNRVVSEQILRMAELAAKGVEVFQDRLKFLAWLTTPNLALSGESPIDLLKSRFGTDMVFDEIGRLEHGVFS